MIILGVAAIISFIGLLAAALLIAILTQKLHLTREEKYVHTFILNARLAKKCKNEAANVIKYSMKVWYLKRHNKCASIHYFRILQNFFESVQLFQQIKQEQKHLVGSCVCLTEIIHVQRKTKVQINETAEQIANIKTEVKQMKKEFKNIKHTLDTLQNTLNVILDKITK
jgi:septal ring factor EnvC (AmiA/AmiB activator)